MRQIFKVLALSFSLVAVSSLVEVAHAERGQSGFVRGGSSGAGSASRQGSWHGNSGGSGSHGRGYRDRGSRGNGYRDRGSRGNGYRDRGYRSGRYSHRGYHGSYRRHGYYPYYGYYSYPRYYTSWYWPSYLSWYWPGAWYWTYPRYDYGPSYYGYRSGGYDDTGYDDDAADGGWRGWGQSDTSERSAEPRERRGPDSQPRQSSGTLRLRTSPGAAIYIDDRFAGAADSNGVLMLNVEDGTHSVAAVQPNQPALARSVKVGRDTRELWLER